jgi:SAM-dependent methyltransferase
MKSSSFLRKLKRSLAIYRELGTAATVSRLRYHFDYLLGRDNPDHAEWMRNKAGADAAFDAAHGTQTGGIQKISDLTTVGENAQYGSGHIASDPKFFAEMMADLQLDLHEFSFVDLGSGKGRALMLASAFPFRRLIGVEFAYELHEAAKENIAKLPASAASRVDLIHGDAAKYSFTLDPIIIYLFNPFGPTVIRQVAENALNSWRNAPRPVHILYMNPIHLTNFTDAGWRLSNNVTKGYAHLVP